MDHLICNTLHLCWCPGLRGGGGGGGGGGPLDVWKLHAPFLPPPPPPSTDVTCCHRNVCFVMFHLCQPRCIYHLKAPQHRQLPCAVGIHVASLGSHHMCASWPCRQLSGYRQPTSMPIGSLGSRGFLVCISMTALGQARGVGTPLRVSWQEAPRPTRPCFVSLRWIYERTHSCEGWNQRGTVCCMKLTMVCYMHPTGRCRTSPSCEHHCQERCLLNSMLRQCATGQCAGMCSGPQEGCDGEHRYVRRSSSSRRITWPPRQTGMLKC